MAWRADAGDFAADWPLRLTSPGSTFAIGTKRIAPVWHALAGIAETDWVEAIDMPGTQVAVASYCPAWSTPRGCGVR